MLTNPYIKNILSAILIAFFGFILLNLTFILDFIFQSVLNKILRIFIKVDLNMGWRWLPPAKHVAFVIFILLISWVIFKFNIGDIYKATYSVVPIAVILVTFGILLNHWPIIVYGISTLFVGAVIFYLYKTKKHWFYYYALILVASLLLIMSITSTDI